MQNLSHCTIDARYFAGLRFALFRINRETLQKLNLFCEVFEFFCVFEQNAPRLLLIITKACIVVRLHLGKGKTIALIST